MKPLGNRVLLEPIKESSTDSSGLVRPEDSKKKEILRGKIVGVGSFVDFELNVGQEVLFSPYHYEEIRKDLFVIEDKDIWVVCE